MATDSKVSWKSSDASVVSVTGGKLKALKEGTADITATAGKKSATVKVTVLPAGTPFVAVTGITGLPPTATANVPLTLTGTVEPPNATNQTIVWTVKDAGTTDATIEGATLNATAAGTVTVTATIAGGATATTPYAKDFDIEVFAESTKSITFNTTSGAMGTSGSTANFSITTSGIADGLFGVTAQWYSTSAGTGTPISAPAGIGCHPASITGNSANVQLHNLFSPTPAGTYYFRVTIDGVQSSNVATLIVTAAPTVTFDSPATQTVAQGKNVDYPITTSGIADGSYPGDASSIQFYSNPAGTAPISAPAGIAMSGMSPLENNSISISIATLTTSPVGTYYFRATIDGAQSSNVATLIVTAAPTVTFDSPATQTVAQGKVVHYQITTSGIADGSYPGDAASIQFYSNPAGTAPISAPAGIGKSGSSPLENNSISISIATLTTSPVGTYYFRATIDGVQSSNVATLIVTPPAPTIAATVTGLSNLNVGAPVSGQVTLTLSNGEYIASPYPADFDVSGLPPGVVVSGMVRTSNTVITLIIGGTPTTVNTGTVTLTIPSIPARNVTGATAEVPVSGTITAGPVAGPIPTSVSFSNANIYTWHGKANNLGMTVSPSNADRNKITWTQTATHPNLTAISIVNTGTGSAVARVNGSGSDGSTASNPYSVTLTARLPNGNSASVTLKAKFGMWIFTSISPIISAGGWFNQGITYSWNNAIRTQYVRAYYGANETEWAYTNNTDHEGYLSKISTGDYTITSSSADITVTKNADGITYNLTRSSASGLRAVTLTITAGAQTYTQVVNLVD